MANYKDSNGSIYISFESIPSYETRRALKAHSFRWNPLEKEWYASLDPDRLNFAKKLCTEGVIVNHDENKPIQIEMNRRCCYSASVECFLTENIGNWVKNMKFAFSEEYRMALGDAQVSAWGNCFDNLQEQLKNLTDAHKKALHIIFEYSIPYESGRRPDVILLSKTQVFVLEYKKKSNAYKEDMDQVAAYTRDLGENHFESREKKIIPLLVLTMASDNMEVKPYPNGVIVCPGDKVAQVLEESFDETVEECDPDKWMNSKYEPLPTIVEAAKLFMKNEELPNIRRVNSTHIPQAIEFLSKLANEAKENKQHVLAFVTGVPGAGKTFLGLNFVYKVCNSVNNANSIYLSGNGPLIKVLQDALKSHVFVQDVHKVINEYVSNKMDSYNKNIIVFDEGQRAWDKNQMKAKRSTTKSEPDIFVEIADKLLDWSVLLILVGEGQEINFGEHGGIAQWNVALENARKSWQVACPEKLTRFFPGRNVKVNNDLNLNTTLRSYLASDVSKFVNSLLAGQIDEAKELRNGIDKAGFAMYITRDFKIAKSYCTERYKGTNKRFGLMASSKAYNLQQYNMKPAFKPNVASWFNREPSDSLSCRALKTIISEFDCQGLEIDFPIICWGTDMLWEGGHWSLFKDSEAADSETNTNRINSYRVLLTRGRDGFIIYVPKDKRLDSIYELFKEIGITCLTAANVNIHMCH